MHDSIDEDDSSLSKSKKKFKPGSAWYAAANCLIDDICLPNETRKVIIKYPSYTSFSLKKVFTCIIV